MKHTPLKKKNSSLKKTPLKANNFKGLKSNKSTLKKSKIEVKKKELIIEYSDITDIQKHKICNLYKKGFDIEQLSRKFNCKAVLILEVLNKHKISIRSPYIDYKHASKRHDWKKVRAYCLSLFAEVVKLSAHGKCETCGKTGTDAHHWYYTKAHNAMTDIYPLNGICLCRECHTKAHADYKGFRQKVLNLTKYKDAEKELQSVFNKKIDYDFINNLVETIKFRIQLLKQNQKRQQRGKND